MTSTDSTHMQAARAAIEQGQLSQARRLLRSIIQSEPENHRAWLWLAGVTESPTASLEYVRRAHALQPDDATVGKALAWAEQRSSAPAAASDAPHQRLVAGAGVTAPPLGLPVRPAPDPTPATTQPAPDISPSLTSGEAPPRNWGLIAGLLIIIVVAVIALILVIRWASKAASAAELPARVVAAPQAMSRLTAGVGAPGPRSAARLTRADVPHSALGDIAYVVWRQAEADHPAIGPAPESEAAAPVSEAIPADPNTRWIDVNLTTQTLVAYENDTPVYDVLISSGMWPFLTVTGQFHIYLRLASQDMSGYHLGYDYYLPNVPYVMYFYQDYALHGAYWHNNFGVPMSHGCVNLDLDTAAWLYDFASVGTLVNVHY